MGTELKKDVNKIFIENKEKGTTEWELHNPALKREIEGYASENSINIGESIEFFVNTSSEKYSITVFRMGWYDGQGARKMSDPVILSGVEQVIPEPDSEFGLVECDWQDPYELAIPQDWVSGVYVVKLEEQKNKKQSYIIFVVRDEEHNPDIIFQLPVTTYQAYNFWGGKSLYEFGSGSLKRWGAVTGIPATKVSFNRPYARSNNAKAAYAMGAGEFFANVQPVTTHHYPISSAAWDYNMVRWLERNGYDIGYITSTDTHQRPNVFMKTKILIPHGHDEYWSYEMRNNVKNARDNGVNITFISSNTIFWQIRFEESTITNKPCRTIVCYKEAALDPVKGKLSTINFRDIPEQKSEAALIGVKYVADPVKGDIIVSNQSHWIYKDTDLKDGDSLEGLLGYEVDGIALDSPKNTVILGTTICQIIGFSYPLIMSYMFKKIINIPANLLLHKNIISLPANSLQTKKKPSNNNYQKNLFWITFLVIAVVFILIGMASPTLLIGLCILTTLFFAAWFIKIVSIKPKKFTSNMSIYEAESGAQVFATGSMQWAWGLDDFNSPTLRPSCASQAAEVITKNILYKFGAKSAS